MAENKDKASKTTANAPDADAGQDQVDENLAREQARGYRGVKVDPTPDEHYTVAGVTAGLPTPESDKGLAEHEAHVADVAESLPPPPTVDETDAGKGE